MSVWVETQYGIADVSRCTIGISGIPNHRWVVKANSMHADESMRLGEFGSEQEAKHALGRLVCCIRLGQTRIYASAWLHAQPEPK